MYNCLSIHETVQLIVMHATHTVTLLVKLKCRGNAVQREEETEKEQNKTTRHGVTVKFKQSQTMIAFAPTPTDGLQMLTKYPTL